MSKKSRFTLGLTELAVVLGCHKRMATRIVDSLGIKPYKVELRRRKFALNEAQVKRCAAEYHRIACGKGHSAALMRGARRVPLSPGERLVALRQSWLDVARARRAREKRPIPAHLRLDDGGGS